MPKFENKKVLSEIETAEFFNLVSEDHGYFRFDDDIDNEDDKIHPRSHFDFSLKNSSALKIGLDTKMGLEPVINMLDPMKPKWYLRE